MSRPKREVGLILSPPCAERQIVKSWLPPKEVFSAPSRVTNATTSGTYTGEVWRLRPGAEAHKQFRSVGLG